MSLRLPRCSRAKVEIGTAWKKAVKDKNSALSAQLVAPFRRKVYAALVVIDGVHSLAWSRGTGPRED